MPVTIVRSGDRGALNVLGMPLRMLCEARETNGAWSLFEEEVPFGMGPPAHRHDWDEAYYILNGEVDFELDGETIERIWEAAERLYRSGVHPGLSLCVRRHGKVVRRWQHDGAGGRWTHDDARPAPDPHV